MKEQLINRNRQFVFEEEKLDVSMYFMELVQYANKGKSDGELDKLFKEAGELLSIYVASINTAKCNRSKIENLQSKNLKSIIGHDV